MTRRFTIAAALVLGLALASTAGNALATPGSGVSSSIAVGHFDAIDVKSNALPDHQVKINTKGATDMYVVTNTFAPGATTGWHTHPGASLLIVSEGTATVYEDHDPNCAPRLVTKESGVIDANHVHLVRNETSERLVIIAVQFLPAGAARRIDAPAPEQCLGVQ